MTRINDALRGGLSGGAGPAGGARSGGARIGGSRALVVGGVGPLGAAVLEQVLGSGGFVSVAALVSQPVAVSLRGFEAWPFAGAEQPPLPGQRAEVAVLVFDRERHRHGREAAFVRPQPEGLLALGHWLLGAGVRRLVVVMPHAPTLMPQALRAGLANLDEQALAGLGFEQLVIVRPARSTAAATGPAAGPWLARVAQGVLAQLHWMVPQREQPLRAVKVARFVVQLLRALPQATAGTRVAPPELLWDWAQPGGGGDALLRQWLAEGRWQSAPAAAMARW